ncbi:hypothetical protein RRG08_042770 [Elysia crispata]|uniref:Uncharacterized protein n=1 Tax=Elysia crispata TaxID=231223 RepID=A0AAE1CKJ0_9GAST|nr:hypothetical protein RRG08_042770 [Elysia crispata]
MGILTDLPLPASFPDLSVTGLLSDIPGRVLEWPSRRNGQSCGQFWAALAHSVNRPNDKSSCGSQLSSQNSSPCSSSRSSNRKKSFGFACS